MPKLQIQRGRSSQPAGLTANPSNQGKSAASASTEFTTTKFPPKPKMASKSTKMQSSDEEEEYDESESFMDEITDENIESDPDDDYVEDDESQDEESESSNDYEDEDEVPSKKGKGKSLGRAVQKNTKQETKIPRSRTSYTRKFSDIEDKTPTRRSSRSTAKRAMALIAAAVAEDDNSSFQEDHDDESDGATKKLPHSGKKKSPFKTSGLDHNNDFKTKKTMPSSTNTKAKTPLKEIGDADSISFDESSESEISPKKLLSPKLRMDKGRSSNTFTKISAPISPVRPPCTSTHDCITMEALPRLHVCYHTPDNRSCHCFALETLYKAAMMPGLKRYKPDGRLAFLQPPHFRTIIDGNLEDQIASRFGRRALIIEESSVYLSKQDPYQRHTHHLQDDSDNDNRLVSFEERLSKYLTDQMGSGDLYCCPICYSEAHQRFLGLAFEDDANSGDESYEALLSTVTASKVDPMSILGSLDDEEFHVASCFCFRKVVNVKNHIVKIHAITLKSIDANSLLKKFKIRDQDGLLQRHLLEYYHGRVRSTSMRNYWTEEGNDRAFILLRSLIELKEESGEDDEDGSSEFCTSFPKRARQMWYSLSAPFEKDLGDVEDFITDELGEEEGDIQPVHIFEQPKNLEDEIVQALRRKGNKNNASSPFGDDKGSSEEASEESEELEIEDEDDFSDNEDFESSGEDSWYQKKRNDSKQKRKRQSPTRTPPLRKLKSMEGEDSDDDSSILVVETPVGLSSAESRKRRIIDDD